MKCTENQGFAYPCPRVRFVTTQGSVDRREGSQGQQLRHVPTGGGGASTEAIRGNPATDRRPATEARAGVKRGVAQRRWRLTGGVCLYDGKTTEAGCSEADCHQSRLNLPRMAPVPYALVIKFVALAFERRQIGNLR